MPQPTLTPSTHAPSTYGPSTQARSSHAGSARSSRSRRRGGDAVPDGPGPDRNLVLVVGEAAGDAVVVSAAGLPVTTFDLRVRSGSTSTLVPVRWSGQHDVVEGARLGVLGEVARRFFRAGGATQSRTEVLAVRVEHAGAAGIPKRLLGQAKRILDQ